jgi:tryptophan-rich sensory protein
MFEEKAKRIGWHLQWFVAWICISFLAPVPAALISDPGSWYDQLVKPAVVPPGWVFSVVWTTIYFLMGVAAYLVWSTNTADRLKRNAIILFCLQLVINALWSPIFFGLHSLYGGIFCLGLLILLVSITACYFWKISRPAGLIFSLYLLWLLFAFYLNFSIIILDI